MPHLGCGCRRFESGLPYKFASLAQLAEHDICNIEVVGSIPTGGSNVIDMCSTCPNCSKPLTKKHAKYCSNKCQQAYLRNQYIQRWKQGLETGLKGQFGISKYIREYLLNKHNFKCQKCGWGKLTHIQTHLRWRYIILMVIILTIVRITYRYFVQIVIP